jgi:Ni,Fe-hydrogenase III large subunit
MENAQINTNPGTIALNEIPVFDYDEFYNRCCSLLQHEQNHCLNYFGWLHSNKIRFFCLIADDKQHSIYILSHEQPADKPLQIKALSTEILAMHIFEREINENFGIEFIGHPWLKPLRYASNRYDKTRIPATYPFYSINSEELHEVGVGPVHAGIIEPGHFRFICNGENILHLEIQLGYQHRGIERLFTQNKGILQQAVLAEQIAGDTAIGHSLTYAGIAETLACYSEPLPLKIIRTIALEMERIAIHIGDTAALCTDIAYQLGQISLEPLRTTIINTMLEWCGNRFGKGFIRPGGSHYYPDKKFLMLLQNNLKDVLERFSEITARIYSLPGVLARFEECGRVSKEQMKQIGAVGMAARMTGLERDIRISHPSLAYKDTIISTVTLDTGDVLARGLLRKIEVMESVNYIYRLIDKYNSMDNNNLPQPDFNLSFNKNMLAISLTEGWRGEICHTAITGEKGTIMHYKIKDPSMHNWLALALAVREEEISNFPVNNKSFNLSYSGFDL